MSSFRQHVAEPHEPDDDKGWDADIRKNMDTYVNVAASTSSPLERAAVARRYGLVHEAIAELRKSHEALQKQLENDGDRKRFSPADSALHLAVHADLIELLLYDGHAEEASQILDSIDTPETIAVMGTETLRGEYYNIRRRALIAMGMDPRNPGVGRYDTDPAAHYRSLRQAVSMVVGDFKGAADIQVQDLKTVRGQFDTYRTQFFPAGLPITTTLPNLFDRELDRLYRPLLAPLNPVAAYLGGQARLIHIARLETMLALVRARTDMHARLAMTYLEAGDVRSAAHHFRQAQDVPGSATPISAQLIAREYLKSIDRVAVRQGTGP